MLALWESVQTIAKKEGNEEKTPLFLYMPFLELSLFIARALGKQVSPAFTSSLAEVLYSQMGRK